MKIRIWRGERYISIRCVPAKFLIREMASKFVFFIATTPGT